MSRRKTGVGKRRRHWRWPPIGAPRPELETDHDLKPFLHNEINRLPESQRVPVVLCDLQGLTYNQAADQLRWTVPTLRCRLARARQRLKDRLLRRGFAAPALGAALSAGEAKAAVPAVLIRSTVLAATGGSASSGVVLLTHFTFARDADGQNQNQRSGRAGGARAGLAGVMALGGQRRDDARPAMKSKAAQVIREKPEPARLVETVEIKGRVVAPDGKPVAGAAVTTLYIDIEALNMDTTVPWPRTTSDSDGRFSIRLPKPELDASVEGYLAMEPWLVASAPDYGVGWCGRGFGSDRPAEQVLTLVAEGPPIEGRIVDLEGRPVAGASVRAAGIWFDEKGNLAGWIAKARNGAAGNLWQALQRLSFEPTGHNSGPYSPRRALSIATTTGADGRFKLTGIGHDRIAELIISGTGIATTQAHVFSRPELEIRTADKGMVRSQPFIVHAPKFQLALRQPGAFRVRSAIKTRAARLPDWRSGRPSSTKAA